MTTEDFKSMPAYKVGDTISIPVPVLTRWQKLLIKLGFGLKGEPMYKQKTFKVVKILTGELGDD